MFTGLIEEVGRVTGRRGARLQISAPRVGKSIRVGESVAVNGCCLTATSRAHDRISFDLLQETLDRTIAHLADNKVNLVSIRSVGQQTEQAFLELVEKEESRGFTRAYQEREAA